jgi:diadenosine tetraphosphate (Ap4A) HIT family hydrolase
MLAELYGGAWGDTELWAHRRVAEGCAVCRSGRPFGLLGELEHTWVTTDPEVAVRGYVCIVSKAHVVEPFELPEAEGIGFWLDCVAVAQALADLFRPVKMNYEVHGNTLPHLHMHLLPRQPGDAFVGRPLNLKERHYTYTEADLDALKAMVARLSPGGATGRATDEP